MMRSVTTVCRDALYHAVEFSGFSLGASRIPLGLSFDVSETGRKDPKLTTLPDSRNTDAANWR